MDSLLSATSQNVLDFWASPHSIKIYESPPTSEEFLRDCVAPHVPCIIRGALEDWGAMKWNLDYLKDKLNDKMVEINVTPDGRGDAVIETPQSERIFAYPAELTLKFSDFVDNLNHRYEKIDDDEERAVFYLSQQDDNLRRHYSELLDDIKYLPLAESAFTSSASSIDGLGLAAANLWIGDERSVSTMHKDFFENLYCVVEGEKLFTLMPPVDVLFLEEKEFATRRWCVNTPCDQGKNLSNLKKSDLHLSADEDHRPQKEVSWLCFDPDLPEHSRHFERCHPIRVSVTKGEVLYLPAMWYHRVTQSCTTIAVNFWYEQRFDHRYVYYQLCRQLKDMSDKHVTTK